MSTKLTYTKAEEDEIMFRAFDKGIEVFWAKRKEDIEIEGIHLLEPPWNALIEGLEKALRLGCMKVIIHRRATYPSFH